MAKEVTNKKLSEKIQKLENELSLIRGIQHDLRNQYIAQEGFQNFLLKGIESLEIPLEKKSKLKETMMILKQIALDAHTILNDATDFMAFEEGKFSINPTEKTYLFTTTQSVINQYALQIEQYGFNVENEIAQDIEVNVLEHHAKRIMYNLFGNSIKFNTNLAKKNKADGKPPVRIVIGAADLVEVIEWHIWDNGIGLDSVKTEDIFKEFHREDTHESGTGLGLSIARKIVKEYGGNIIAEGSKDPEKHYSDFIITLPKPKLY